MLSNVTLNIIEIDAGYGRDHGLLQALRAAPLGKLSSIILLGMDSSKGFLEAFESVAHTTSIPATLSEFLFFTPHSWKPNYLSLLPFTQLRQLVIEFSCWPDCSSTVDDDVVADLARTLPKLEILRFGRAPCGEPTGITAKGFAVLACHCPRLSCLSIHFQIANFSLSDVPRVTSGGETSIPREECALTELHVGYTVLPDQSASMAIEILTCIFPHLEYIDYSHVSWRNAANEMMHVKRFVDPT